MDLSEATAECGYTYVPFDEWMVCSVEKSCDICADRMIRLKCTETCGIRFTITVMSGVSLPDGISECDLRLVRVVYSSVLRDLGG